MQHLTHCICCTSAAHAHAVCIHVHVYVQGSQPVHSAATAVVVQCVRYLLLVRPSHDKSGTEAIYMYVYMYNLCNRLSVMQVRCDALLVVTHGSDSMPPDLFILIGLPSSPTMKSPRSVHTHTGTKGHNHMLV